DQHGARRRLVIVFARAVDGRLKFANRGLPRRVDTPRHEVARSIQRQMFCRMVRLLLPPVLDEIDPLAVRDGEGTVLLAHRHERRPAGMRLEPERHFHSSLRVSIWKPIYNWCVRRIVVFVLLVATMLALSTARASKGDPLPIPSSMIVVNGRSG